MPYKLLIVDDSGDFREPFRDFLEGFGYQVQEVSNGREALDLLRGGHDIDLVFLDVSMPGLSGIAVLNEIRKTDLELKVIILTCYGAHDLAVSVPRGHMQGCIEKTMDPDKIRGLIKKVLKKNRRIGPIPQAPV